MLDVCYHPNRIRCIAAGALAPLHNQASANGGSRACHPCPPLPLSPTHAGKAAVGSPAAAAAAAMAPPFVLPEVEENADSWGPQAVPPQFDGVPFMPFQKGERLGRIADFGQMAGRGMFAGALLLCDGTCA